MEVKIFELTTEYIKKVVEKNGFIKDLDNKKRTNEYVFSRCVYFKLCKSFNDYQYFTFRAIGKTVNKDHSGTIHGLKIFESLNNQAYFNYYKKLYDFCYSEIANDLQSEKYKIGIQFDKLKHKIQALDFNDYQDLHNQIEEFIELKCG